MKTTKRALTAAVLLSCACLMAPYYAHAEEEKPSCDHPSSYMTVEAGNLTYNFDIYNASTHPGEHWRGEYEENDDGDYILDANGQRIKVYTSYRPLFTNEEKAFGDSIAYIHKMLNPTKAFSPTIKLELLPEKDANAAASSETHITYDSNGKPVQIGDTKLAAVLQGKYKPEGNDIVAEIEVDLAPAGTSWYIDKFPVLPSNGINSDYYGTIAHEMFHALGLVANVSADSSGDITFGTSGNYYDSGYFRSRAVFNKYEMGLRDVFGRVGYYALDSNNNYHDYDENPINPNNTTSIANINGTLMSRNIVSISVEQYNNLLNDRNSIDSQTFYILRDPVNNTDDDTEDEERESVDRYANQSSTSSSASLPEGTKINQNGGVYFTGAHIKDVLTTGSDVAKIAWPDGSTVPAVEGLPVNCYEGSDENSPELSHIELQNGQMSHQNYRNWCSFMEAELALMQDLGYDIDRGAYFGKSIYNSGEVLENNTVDYFTYTNNKAFDSTQMHGIGLHVYGSYVDVTQAADIKANGDYGIGIRVDGVGNKVNIDSNISANGEGGNGLLVAYGKEHDITLNAGKTIEATDTEGVAARFDFGSNELGDEAEYRGSYFSVSYKKVTNSSGSGDNQTSTPVEILPGDVASRLQATIDSNEQEIQYQWVPNSTPDSINGELVTNFNVAGTLKGEKAAIYISENALVKNINILSGADIQGNIISKWNPNKIKYQNDDSDPLAPDLVDENGLTNLTFGGTAIEQNTPVAMSDDQETSTIITFTPDPNFNMSYNGKIDGIDSLKMNIAGGTLDYNGSAKVYDVTINEGATLKGNGTYELGWADQEKRNTFTNNGTFDLGNGIQNISITGNYNQTSDGTLGIDFNSDADRDTLTISDGKASIAGTISLTPQVDYYFNGQTIKLDQIVNGRELEITAGKPDINNISPVLEFTVADNDFTYEDFQCNYADTKYVINVKRVEQGYQSVADDKISSGIGSALDSDAKQSTEKVYVGADKLKLIQAIDFPLTTTNTDAERKKVMNTNIKKLNPNVVGSQAQAVLETHTTLNNLVSVTSLVNAGSMSMNAPVAVKRGGLGPTKVEPPKYNSWRNIVIPFAAYTNQHNGSNGYTNHNSGVIGAMERTFANGLTHGYHAAINHQSTEDSGSTIKGEGLYLGTHASYAPEEWNGWSVFGSARLGVEQMRSHRRVYIPSAVPYIGTADGDWTGYSGSFNIGAALTKEHGVMRSGPFAALDYSFAHRPSVHEDGGAVRTNLESATYDSLRTQLGYRLVTNPKALHSYDSTQWQAHASVAWNHELLSDNGRTNYQLVEFPGATVEDDIETYGRDSMSIAAGIIFKTPNRLDVGLTLGSDIYRKGGSSIYGKVNFEWKF